MKELLREISKKGLFFEEKGRRLRLHRDKMRIKSSEEIEPGNKEGKCNLESIIGRIDDFRGENNKYCIEITEIFANSFNSKMNLSNEEKFLFERNLSRGEIVIYKKELKNININELSARELIIAANEIKEFKDVVTDTANWGKVRIEPRIYNDKDFSEIAIIFEKTIDINNARLIRDRVDEFLSFYFKKNIETKFIRIITKENNELFMTSIGREIFSKHSPESFLDKIMYGKNDFSLMMNYIEADNNLRYIFQLYNLWVRTTEEIRSFNVQFLVLMSVIDGFYGAFLAKNNEKNEKEVKRMTIYEVFQDRLKNYEGELFNFENGNKIKKWLEKDHTRKEFVISYVRLSEKIKKVYECARMEKPEEEIIYKVNKLRNNLSHGNAFSFRECIPDRDTERIVFGGEKNSLEIAIRAALEEKLKEVQRSKILTDVV